MLPEGTTNERGEVYSRADMGFLPRPEYERRKADREERAFMRRANQGQLSTPMVIADGMPAVQSMATGRWHDSKSEIRREYREQGVVEVGNDSSLTSGKRRPEPGYYEKQAAKQDRQKAIGRAFAAVDTMSEDTVRRRRFEREQATARAASPLPT